MLHLMESAGQPRSRGSGWMMGSTLMHGALIATAATIGTNELAARVREPQEGIIYTAPSPASPRFPAPASATAPLGAPVTRPVLHLSQIPLPGVRDLGDFIPRPAAARDWDGTTGLATAGEVGGPGLPRIFDDSSVDQAVAAKPGNRSPEYPSALRSAGVSGEVLVRFVVDTTGRVEPASIEIPHASHELFADAVRRWLPRTRYSAAQLGGRPVRQLVEQRVEFALAPK